MGLQRFPLGGFLGGMNLVDNPFSLKPGEAQLAMNVEPGLRDVLSARKGFTSSGLAGVVASQTKSPTTFTSTEGEFPGTSAWTNPGNAASSNNVYATASFPPKGGVTKELRGTNCGFSLPVGAKPIAVSVRFECKEEGTPGQAFDEKIQLLVASSPSGTYKTLGTPWPTVDAYRVYGGSEDIWGIPTLSKAQVEAVGFGFLVQAFCGESGEAGLGIFVDHMEITVYYLLEGVTSSTEHARPWYSGAKRRLMLSQDGDVRVLDGTTITELFNGTAATTWCFEQMEYNSGGFKDSVWMMNGTDAAKKWDGTTFANWAGKPPKGNMLRVWKNMMVVSGVAAFPQRVFFSDIGNPESPEDETNGGYGNRWIDIRTSEDDLDPITWMEVLDDVLLVFKKKSVNAITDSTTFSFQRIANIGCEGRFQSCILDERAYFLNRSGVYSVTAQGSVRYESLNIEPLFKGTGPVAMEGIDLSPMAATARMNALPNGRVQLAVTPKGWTGNFWLLECYPRLRGAVDRQEPRTPWVLHQFGNRFIQCLASYRSKDSEIDKVIAGVIDAEAGTVKELVYLFEGTRDGLLTTSWQWQSGFKSLISEEPFERVRRVNVLMKGKMFIIIETDEGFSESGELESEEEGKEVSLERYRPEKRARYHALQMSGVGPTPTQVFDVEFALRGGKEH